MKKLRKIVMLQILIVIVLMILFFFVISRSYTNVLPQTSVEITNTSIIGNIIKNIF